MRLLQLQTSFTNDNLAYLQLGKAFSIRRYSQPEGSEPLLGRTSQMASGCFGRWFWVLAKVKLDEHPTLLLIHKRSFKDSVGIDVEQVLGTFSKELPQLCTSVNQRLDQLRLPFLSLQVNAVSGGEQDLILRSIDLFSSEKIRDKAVWRADVPWARKVSLDLRDRFLCVHLSKTKQKDPIFGKGRHNVVKSAFQAVLDEEGHWKFKKIAEVKWNLSKLTTRKDYRESLRVLPIIRSLRGTPGIPTLYRWREYYGKRGAEKFSLLMDLYKCELFSRIKQCNDELRSINPAEWPNVQLRSIRLEERQKWIVQLLTGLKALHEKGVIHCDIKPENIVLDEEGNAYFIDFGLSILKERTRRTPCGTVHYIAPEVWKRKRTEKSDLFSLGIVFAQLFMKGVSTPGATQLQNCTTVDLSKAYAGWCLQRLRNQGVDSGIASLIETMLALDPSVRPTAGYALASFQRILAIPKIPRPDLQTVVSIN